MVRITLWDEITLTEKAALPGEERNKFFAPRDHMIAEVRHYS